MSLGDEIEIEGIVGKCKGFVRWGGGQRYAVFNFENGSVGFYRMLTQQEIHSMNAHGDELFLLTPQSVPKEFWSDMV